MNQLIESLKFIYTDLNLCPEVHVTHVTHVTCYVHVVVVVSSSSCYSGDLALHDNRAAL